MFQSRFRSLALLTASVAMSGAAMAQSKTWTLNDTSTAAPSTAICSQTATGTTSGTLGLGNAYGCQQQPTGTTNTLTITGWGSTGTGGAFAAAAVTPQGGNGYGVGNANEGGSNTGSSAPGYDHSVDNNGSIDMLLLNFTTGAEALTHVTLGWTGFNSTVNGTYYPGDGDFQVLRWTGSTAPVLTSRTASNLVSTGGWELVSTINAAGNIDTPNVEVSGFNNNNLTSSYWLLSAYNSNLTGAVSGTRNDAVTAGIDALKFLAVGTTTTTPGRVPEPVSLALVATALVGVGMSRRRKA